MKHVVVGLSHQTASVEVRERLAIRETELGDVLRLLSAVDGVDEVLLLSTCNRTEIYATTANPEREAARLKGVLAGLAKVPQADLDGHLYAHLRGDAVRHVFRVAASLDSMIVGESQILGQVKAALAQAESAEVARTGLRRLMDRAFTVAKRVRAETAIGANPASISSVAVDLAKNIFGDLRGRSVLLIGAGKMGRLTLRHLQGAGVGHVYVANRTRERAAAVLGELDPATATFVPLDRVLEPLEKVDVAVSSVQVESYLFDRESARALNRRRHARPLFLVDISVPRSLDPAVHQEGGIFLYDIDDLRMVVEGNLASRRAEAGRAGSLVEDETHAYTASLKEADVVPTIRELVDGLERIRLAELERHAQVLERLDPAARATIELATRAMFKKVAHGAIVELKRSVRSPDGAVAIEALRRALCGRGPNDGSAAGGDREGE